METMQKTIENKNASEQMRVVRGYAILGKGDTPREIAKETYIVPSQSGNGEYTVTRNGMWQCSCPDFIGRKLDCKHIHAVRLFFELKRKVYEDSLPLQQAEEKQSCPYCKGSDVIKMGRRVCKAVIKQRYLCNGCKRKFIADKDFERIKGDATTTTLIMDLYFRGISLRGIEEHLRQFYGLELDHSNILRRIQRYSKIINDYVTTLQPEVGDVWNTDEMKIQAGGKWRWLWNVMDGKTRFLISRMVTDKRRIKDSTKLFCKATKMAGRQPIAMIHDGCHAYTESMKLAMPKAADIRLTSIRDKRTNNNNIERLNGTVRDRIKTMRGMQNNASADIMTSAFANYYNFLKPHSALDGRTPAEAAGIDLQLDGNKWEKLLRKAMQN